MGYLFSEEDHLHTLDGIPLHGTTTILGEVVAKNLTWWASSEACKVFGFINQRPYKGPKPSEKAIFDAAKPMLEAIKGMELKEYCALLDKAYRAHSKSLDKSAKEGTDLHSQIEGYICTQLGQQTAFEVYTDQVTPFIDWSKKNVRRFLWSEACHYSRRLWVGGKSDFAYEGMDGRVVLGDIKSAKEAYLSHFLQAGAYDIQIFEGGLYEPSGKQVITPLSRACKIDAYAIFPFGNGFKEPVIETRTDMFKAGFEAALRLYHVKKEFDGE